MSGFELVYFNGRGRGEVSRLLFQAAGQQFVDTRIEMADWPKFKPGKLYTAASFAMSVIIFFQNNFIK